jgi:hypothetical protein
MQVATSAPQTSRGLLAVGSVMAKLLAVVALSKASQSFIYLYVDDNMIKAGLLEYHLRFYIS